MIGGGLFPAGYQQQRDAGLAALRRRRMRTGVADFPVVAEEIARLIGLLDDDSADVAEDAKAKLISIGMR